MDLTEEERNEDDGPPGRTIILRPVCTSTIAVPPQYLLVFAACGVVGEGKPKLTDKKIKKRFVRTPLPHNAISKARTPMPASAGCLTCCVYLLRRLERKQLLHDEPPAGCAVLVCIAVLHGQPGKLHHERQSRGQHGVLLLCLLHTRQASSCTPHLTTTTACSVRGACTDTAGSPLSLGIRPGIAYVILERNQRDLADGIMFSLQQYVQQ